MVHIQNISKVRKIVADTLSMLTLNGNEETTHTSTYQNKTVSDINNIKELPEGIFPIS